MLTASTKKHQEITAWDATRDDGPFSCLECSSQVVLRQAMIRAAHFAHVPPVACSYGTGESEEHRRAKTAIYQKLSTYPEVTKLKLERRLGEVRPDIRFYYGRTPIAIEVQLSSLALSEIIRRTEADAKKGVSVLWTPPFNPRLTEEERYSPKIWEKFLHALYFGRVLYWLEEDLLQPVRFDSYWIEVPSSEWYERGGAQRTEGGYGYYSKRYRSPRFLTSVRIGDLVPITRRTYQMDKMTIPAARLWGILSR